MFHALQSLFFVLGQLTGSLTVETAPAGLPVYMDGNPLGNAPVRDLAVPPGEHTLSLFPSDVIEDAYWRLRTGNTGVRLDALRTLARIDAGTKRIEVRAGATQKVRLDLARANRAPCGLACGASFCLGGLFGLGVAAGYLLALIL